MKIRVIKSSKDTYWYNRCIGQVFEVVDSKVPDDYGCYRVIRDKNTKSYGFIHKEDGEVLSEGEYNTLTEIVEQLEKCNYVTKDHLHRLEDNIAFMSLKEMAKEEQYN